MKILKPNPFILYIILFGYILILFYLIMKYIINILFYIIVLYFLIFNKISNYITNQKNKLDNYIFTYNKL